MTTPLDNILEQKLSALHSEVSQQKTTAYQLAQKQLQANKLIGELKAKYPLFAKQLETATIQSESSSSILGKAEQAVKEAAKIIETSEELYKKLPSVLKSANGAQLLKALENDLVTTSQQQNNQYSKLNEQVSQLEMQVEKTRKNRLALEEQLQRLKMAKAKSNLSSEPQ